MWDKTAVPGICAKTARRCVITDVEGREHPLVRQRRHTVSLVQYTQEPRNKPRMTA